MQATAWQNTTDFEWRQPGKARDGHVLYEGETIAARLSPLAASDYAATGETPYGRWSFTKLGFWKPRWLVREAANQKDVAEFFPKWTWTEGEFRLVNGSAYRWKLTGAFRGTFSVTDAAGREILKIGPSSAHRTWKDWFKKQSHVEILQPDIDRGVLSLLTVAAWYYVLVYEQQSDGAAAATLCM